MKNKIYIALLSISILFSGIQNIPVKADSEYIGDIENKYGILYSLDILSDKYAVDGYISRAEAAAIAIKLGGYQAVDTESEFSDVPNTNEYKGYINAAKQIGLMLGVGDNRFEPNEKITYGQFYNVIMRVTGYEENNNYNIVDTGTYSWMKAQADKELSKVKIGKDDIMTLEYAEPLLLATLDFPCFEIDQLNNVVMTDEVYMNQTFDLYKETGRLNAVGELSLGGREEYDSNQLIITDSKGDDYFYECNNGDYELFLGCDIIYYYQQHDLMDNPTVINMYKRTTSGKQLKLSYYDIKYAEPNLSSITYNDGAKEKKVKISKTADYIYNGRNCYDISPKDLMPTSGYILLTDSDGDEVYDVVNITQYEYIMVAQVNTNNETILDKFTWQVYSFKEGEDAESISITKNSRAIKLSYIGADDIISIAKSRDGKKIKAEVSDGRLIGLVQGVNKTDCTITIGSQTVKCIKNFDFDGIPSNATVTVGLNAEGYAVGFVHEYKEPEISFGYLYKIFESSYGLETLSAKILTSSNEYTVFEIADKCSLNDMKCDNNELINAFCENGKFKSQLVAYKLNSEGKLVKLYNSPQSQGVIEDAKEPLVLNKHFEKNTDTEVTAVYNGFGLTLDFEYNLMSSGIMFDITLNNGEMDAKRSSVKKVSSQAISQSSTPESLYIYNADIGCTSELCVYEHTIKSNNDSYSEDFNTQCFVINKINEVWDENEGEIIKAYSGCHAGKYVEYTMADSLREAVDTEKIKSGDVLLIWLSGKEITKFRRIYTDSEANALTDGTDRECNYGDHNYTGEKIVRESGNWDYPYDWAQHIYERVEGKSGSTSPSGTRWLSLLGSAELVYKGKNYKYPSLRMTVSGKDFSAAYTFDANTCVYVYRGSTIDILDTSNTDFKFDKVVVCARYGNVRDVIAYEE